MPYGYDEYIGLTPDQVLQKISQEQIFELILQQPFSYTARYKSPLREDTEAGCRFEQRPDGTILWVDFADKPIHRTCFRMLMDRTGYSYEGVVRILCKSFSLSTNPADYPTNGIAHRSFFEDTSRAGIDYTKRAFNKRDILYWSKFIIKPQDLLEDNVFSASRIFINNPRKEKPSSFTPIGLCYVIDFLDAVKVYQPYSSNCKWLTNCTADHIGNFDNLPPTGNTLIITKSYKDHRVFRNIGLDDAYSVVWFHNEGSIPSDFLLRSLLVRFSYIIVFYDNDVQGLKAASILVGKLRELRKQGDYGGICMAYIPERLGYKDIGEFIEKEGQRDTLNLLINLL